MGTTSEKLTYLNTTKGKIKDSINLTGANITTEPFRQYSTKLEDAYVDIINNGTDTLYNNFPKVSGEGTSLTLNNTYQAPMRNNLKGNTYQTQYSGKNLLPPTIATETKNGITLTNNGDGSYTLTGTYSSSTLFNIDLPTTLNGTYSFSGNNPTAAKNIQFRILKSSGSPWSTYLNKVNSISEDNTIENGTKQEIRIIGSFTSGFTLKPQLESGSTATSYEPYVGGVAVPNPTSPIPVNVVSGDNEILVNGKNFFPVSLNYNGTSILQVRSTITLDNDEYVFSSTGADMYLGAVVGSGSAFSNSYGSLIVIPSNATNVYLYVANSDFNNNYICFYDDNKNSLGYSSITTSKSIPSGAKYFNVRIGKSNSVSGTTYRTKVMVSFETITTYEPYTIGETYNIDLPVENYIPFPYIDISVTSRHGIDYTINSDNSITISGKATQNTAYTIANQTTAGLRELLLNNDCYLSGGARGGSSSTYTLQLYGYGSTGAGALRDDDGDGKSLSSFENESANFNIAIFIANGTEITTPITFKPMLEIGNKKNSYTPYGTTPIELCKIGNYQDYFYKDSDKWYLHKEIGKVVLNGTETGWAVNNSVFYRSFDEKIKGKIGMFSNFYSYKPVAWTSLGNYEMSDDTSTTTIFIKDTDYTTTTDFKAMLATNLPVLYYVLATPTNTEITYQPLIDQLNELEKAISYENQTNISQVNNDLPFIISASALKKDDVTSNNNVSLLMSVEESPNTNVEEEIDEEPIEEIDEEPVEEEIETQEEEE